MSTVIQEKLSPDIGGVDEFICHLYESGSRFSACGINSKDDPHTLMHRDYGNKSPTFRQAEGPADSCPMCGASICPKCLQEIQRG